MGQIISTKAVANAIPAQGFIWSVEPLAMEEHSGVALGQQGAEG